MPSSKLEFFKVTAILWLLSHCRSAAANDDNIRLLRRLFVENPYSNITLPAINQSTPITISFSTDLIQIILVDEKNQEMKTNVWIQMAWYDYQLSWIPEDYGNLPVIRVLPEMVWRPDIVLLNNADGKYEVSYKSNVLLSSDGNLLWVPPATFITACTMDVKYFPFDEQVCEMRFGSWTYNNREVKLSWGETNCVMKVANYRDSTVWFMTDARGQILTDPQHREYVSYKIVLRRRILFYTINVIIPIALLSLLTIGVFYIPVTEGEKVTLGISVTVALVVFLMLASQILPPTGLSVPLMSQYLLFTFGVNVVSILSSTIIINWHYRTPKTHNMPRWVHSDVTLAVARLLRMQPPDHMTEMQVTRRVARSFEEQNSSTNRSKSKRKQSPKTGRKKRKVKVETENRDERELFASSQFGTDESALETSVFSSSNSRTFDQSNWENKQALADNDNDYDYGNGSGNGNGNGNENENGKARRWRVTDEDEKRQLRALRSGAELQIRDEFTKERISETMKAVNFMAHHLDDDDEYGKVLDEWKFAAAVIDRVQLIVFLLVTVIGTFALLFNVPYFFEELDQSKILQKLKNSSYSLTACE